MTGSILVPNEDGVLVPQHGAPNDSLGPLSESEQALSLAANTGGSGAGMSHFAQASRCGRRARLSAERYQFFAERETALPATKNHFIIGSVYHKLHELLRRPDPALLLDYNEAFKNPNVAEGMRLFKGWMRFWGKDYWGHCLAVEEHLEDSVTFKQKGVPAFAMGMGTFVEDANKITVTGALDMVVDMDAAACERAKKRGLELRPGRRIIDWKTADAPSDGTQYREGLQAIWYVHLWNMHNPDRPVDGIIFDVINKRSRRKDRTVLAEDFQAHYVPADLESVEVLRGMVEQGHRNITEDIPNRSECITWRGDVCPFREHGACDAHS